jgi:hypothetical protein
VKLLMGIVGAGLAAWNVFGAVPARAEADVNTMLGVYDMLTVEDRTKIIEYELVKIETGLG